LRQPLKGARFYQAENDGKEAAFLLHQSIEQAYATPLLVLTNYSPSSHSLRFLRGLAEEQAGELVEIWPESQQRHASWFNILNEAYVKARYSPYFEISGEALQWLSERTEALITAVEKICRDHLERIRPA
jgi:uncharacterized protein